MMEKCISVIVAVYNGEKYIEKCVDSIINQEFKDLEIIIIDDGSQDETEKLCKKYQGIQNLRYIKVQNGGCSRARNIGIEAATGKYIAFVDADDYLEKNMYEEMYRCAVENNSDIVVSGFKKVRETGEIGDIRIPKKNDYKNSFFEILTREEDIFYPVWNKLYKREILIEKKIKFPLDTHMGEDIVFNYKMFYSSRTISVCEVATYNYLLNMQGATQDNRKRGDIYKSFSHIEKFIEEQSIQNEAKDSFNELFYKQGIYYPMETLESLKLKNDKSFEEYYNQYIDEINRFKDYLNFSNKIYIFKRKLGIKFLNIKIFRRKIKSFLKKELK